LAAKHHRDVFVPECKFGPTTVGRVASGRFDAWVMPRSWVHWTTIGYEIKVSRRDFLADQKWDLYLEHCHEFSFVAPPGVIHPSELPDGIGLLEASKNGARLFLRRKAARRDVDAWGPMVYVLMSRCTIGREYEEHNGLEFWRGWIKLKDNDREVGRLVRERMGMKILERELAVEHREDAVKSVEQRLVSTLEDLGIRAEEGDDAQAMLKKLTTRTGLISAMRRHSAWIVESIDRLNATIDRLAQGKDPDE
jgi:hypothetical protein